MKVAVAAAALFLAACSSSHNSTPDVTDQHGPEQKTLTGDLSTNLQKIIAASKNDCDHVDTDLRLRIVGRLDAMKSQIDQAALAQATAAPGGSFQAGQVTFTYPSPNRDKPVDEWRAESESWSNIETRFNRLNDQSPMKAWVALNSAVRSVLMMDENRVINHHGYNFHWYDGPVISAAAQLTGQCSADQSCLTIPFTADQLQFLNRFSDFRQDLVDMNDATKAPADRRALVAKFAKGLAYDLTKYFGWTTVAVTRSDAHTIHVALIDNAGFVADERKISDMIQTAWQTGNDKVVIDWVAPGTANAYTIIADEAIGERASTNRYTHKIELSPVTPTQTITHEFGHVMGLPDFYYEVWNRDMCEYDVETNSANIMSVSGIGSPIKADFDILKALYP